MLHQLVTFSIGKSSKGDEMAAAAASCALDLPYKLDLRGKY